MFSGSQLFFKRRNCRLYHSVYMIFKSYIYINVLRIENAKVILVAMKQPTQLLAGFSDYITLSSKTDKEITAVK